LSGSGTRNGESGQPWEGFDPTAKGRHWAIPGRLLEEIDEDLSELGQHEKLDRLLALGHVTITPGEAWPMYQHYITPADGTPVSDLWTFQPYTGGTVFGTDEGVDEDVRWLSTKDQERLGYPTQKPESLLERIISASSLPGQVVLDPFCGCGTAIAAAQTLGRKWAGIDITHLAITLIKHRLKDAHGAVRYTVTGEPQDLTGARELAESDRFQFQWWALGLVGARPVEQKKGADKGIDGRLYFHEGPGNETKSIIFSVKSGGTGSRDIRDLRGVIEREKAAIGVFLTLDQPTRDMKKEAAEAGFYDSPWILGGKKQKHYRLQIYTIEELLDGIQPDLPQTGIAGVRPFKRARKVKTKTEHQKRLLD